MKKLFTSSGILWSCFVALAMFMTSQNARAEYVKLTAIDGMLSYGQSTLGAETYDKLVDADINTKWGGWFNPALSDEEAWPINKDESANHMYVIVKAEKAVTPEWYFLVTGNDTGGHPERNWASWKIYAGNFANDADAVRNGEGWTLVDDKEDEPLPEASFKSVNLQFDYTGTDKFQYFWIEITKSAANDDVYIQMSEWGLGSYGDFEKYLKWLADQGTGTDEPINCFLIDGDPAGFGGEGVGNLIDGKTDNKWCTGFTNRTESQEDPTANGAWIVFKASRAIAPTYYSLVTGNDTGNNPGRNWKTWRIYGMNAVDEEDVVRKSDNWVLLDSKVNVPAGTGLNELPAANFAQAYFNLSESNTTAFRYFKVEIDACMSDGLMQMSELSLGDEFTLALDRNALLKATAGRYNSEDFAEAALYDQMASLLTTVESCSDPITLGKLTAEVDEMVAKINSSKNKYADLVAVRNAGFNELAGNNIKDEAVEYIQKWISETEVVAPNADYPAGNFAYIKANRQLTGEDAAAEARTFSAFIGANLKAKGAPIGSVGYTFVRGTTDNWNAAEGPESLIDGDRDGTKWGTGTGGDRFIIFKANEPIKPTYYGLVTGGDTGVYTDRNWKNWKIWAANFDSDEEATKDAEGWVLIDVKENVGTDVLKTTSLFESYINLYIGCSEPYEYFKIEVYHTGGMQMNEFTFYNWGDLDIYRKDFVSEFDGYDPCESPAYKGYTDSYKAKYQEMCNTGYAPDLMKLKNELADLQEQIASSADKYAEYQGWYAELQGAGAASEDLQAWYDGYTGENIAPNSVFINGTHDYIMENLQLDNDAIGVAAETYEDEDGKKHEILPSGEIGYIQNMINASIEGVYVLLGGNTVSQWGDGFYGHLIDGIALNGKDEEGNTINATKWGGSADADGNTYIIFRTLNKTNPFFYTLTTGNDTGAYPGRNWGTWYIYGANFEGDADAKKDAEGWVLIDSKENVGQDRLHPVNAEPSYFGFSTETTEEYTYYKVVVTKAYSGTQIQMNELHFGTEEEFEEIKKQYTEDAQGFDYDVIADQALIDEYIAVIPEIEECMNMEALFRVNYKLETLRAAINASAALYGELEEMAGKYAEEAESLTDSDAKTKLLGYITGESAEPSETYPNGNVAYILDEHVLNDSIMQEELAFLEEMHVAAVAAGYGEGADITCLIVNPTFAKAGDMLKDEKGNNVGREAEGWEGYIYRTNTDNKDNKIFAAEFCNVNKTFDVNQTLTNLKNGFYKVTLNAAYRANGDEKMLSYNYAPMAYANDIATYVPVLREGAAETEDEAWKGTYPDRQIYSADSTETYGWGVWGCEGAAHAFAQGRYAITMVAQVTDGTLTFGVKNEGSTLSGSNEWTGVGNFGLVYLGEGDAAGNGVAEAIEEAANYNSERILTLIELYESSAEYAEDYSEAPGFSAAQKATLDTNSGIFTYEAEKLIGETMKSIYETKKAYLDLYNAQVKVYKKWYDYAGNDDAETLVYEVIAGLDEGAYDDAEAAKAAKAQLYADFPSYLEHTATVKIKQPKEGETDGFVFQDEFAFNITTEGTRPYIDLKNLYEPLENEEVVLAFDYKAAQDVENGKILFLTPNLMTDPTVDLATLPAAEEWTTVYTIVTKAKKDLGLGSATDHGIRWYINYNVKAENVISMQARNFRFITKAQVRADKNIEPGDVNGDNNLDIADVVAVLTVMANNGDSLFFGDEDVNGDGTVDIADVVAILIKMASESN